MFGQYAELLIGMREFLADENMQASIMAILRAALSFVQQIPLQAQMNRTQAEAGGMHRMVAQSMRFHRLNGRIQHDACRILSYLSVPTVPLNIALRDYILKTLITAMQDFPGDGILQWKCLITMACASVAQLVRARDCQSLGRRFDSV